MSKDENRCIVDGCESRTGYSHPYCVSHKPDTNPTNQNSNNTELEREIYELVALDTIVDQHAKSHPILNAQDITNKILQLIRNELESVVPKRYRYRHHHDIQVGFRKDDKYSCGGCRKTLEEIHGDDGMGYCPHYRSFNDCIDQIQSNIAKRLGDK